jgi:hypothetical protein
MAANPNNPLDDLANQRQAEAEAGIPWGLVAGIIVIILLGLLAYYFFR